MPELRASGWVVVSPQYTPYGNLNGAKLERITQKRPTSLNNGERAFRLAITIPSEVFAPFAEVLVTVPESAVIEPQVEVG